MEFIQTSQKNHILTATLDRPPVNALNTQLVAELQEISDTVTHSKDIRAVIITANGKVFCAGADLKERKTMNENEVQQIIKNIRSCFHTWYKIPIPVICAMNGGAYGGGLELALMCDIRVIADTAEIGLRETRLGIIPGAGGTQRLSRIAGESAAMRWIVPGKVDSADQANKDGIVDYVTKPDSVMIKANELADEFLKAAPIAVRQAKRAIREGLEKPFEQALQFETECYNVTIPTNDRQEALEAFAEKRDPKWSGT